VLSFVEPSSTMITSISSPPARHDLKIFSLILDFDLLFYMFIYDMIIRCKRFIPVINACINTNRRILRLYE
jgi:hypothetical protein